MDKIKGRKGRIINMMLKLEEEMYEIQFDRMIGDF